VSFFAANSVGLPKPRRSQKTRMGNLNAIGGYDRKTGEPPDFHRWVEQIPNSFQRLTRPQTLNVATEPKLLFHT
jgi:hypothetical protein